MIFIGIYVKTLIILVIIGNFVIALLVLINIIDWFRIYKILTITVILCVIIILIIGWWLSKLIRVLVNILCGGSIYLVFIFWLLDTLSLLETWSLLYAFSLFRYITRSINVIHQIIYFLYRHSRLLIWLLLKLSNLFRYYSLSIFCGILNTSSRFLLKRICQLLIKFSNSIFIFSITRNHFF